MAIHNTSDNRYYIAYEALHFTENYLGNKNIVGVSLMVGTIVKIYDPKYTHFNTAADGNYKQWLLNGYTTHLGKDSEEGRNLYIYVRVSEYNSTEADVIFSCVMPEDEYEKLSDEEKAAAVTAAKGMGVATYYSRDKQTVENLNRENATSEELSFHYVPIGFMEYKSSGYELEYNTGRLGTNSYQEAKDDKWYTTDSINRYVNFAQGWTFELFHAFKMRFKKLVNADESTDIRNALTSTDGEISEGASSFTYQGKTDKINSDSSILTSGWIFGPFLCWLRSKFVRKDNASGTETMSGSLTIGKDLSVSGKASVGGLLSTSNITNSSLITTKNLKVTGRMEVFELMIDKITASGGATLYTPADGFKVDKVEPVYLDSSVQGDASGVSGLGNLDVVQDSQLASVFNSGHLGLKLYFRSSSDNETIYNMWQQWDQALCMTFNRATTGTSHNVSNKYWWSLVRAVSDQPVQTYIDGTQESCHYIVVSAVSEDSEYNKETVSTTDPDGLPIVDGYLAGVSGGQVSIAIEPGDSIAMLGHRPHPITYTTEAEKKEMEKEFTRRGNAILISAYSELDTDLTAPFYAQYRGVRSFDLKSYRKTYFDANSAKFVGEFATESDGTDTDLIDYIEKNKLSIFVTPQNLTFVEDAENNQTKTVKVKLTKGGKDIPVTDYNVAVSDNLKTNETIGLTYSRSATSSTNTLSFTVAKGKTPSVDGVITITYEGNSYEYPLSIYTMPLSSLKVNCTEKYGVSNSETKEPDVWTTYDAAIAEWDRDNKYLWNKQIYSDDNTRDFVTAHVVCVWTADGVGIEDIVNYYKASSESSIEQAPDDDSGWSTLPETLSTSAIYQWNYEKVIFTNGNVKRTTPTIIGYYSEDSIKVDIDNEMDGVVCDKDSKIASEATKTTTVHMYRGSTELSIKSIKATFDSSMFSVSMRPAGTSDSTSSLTSGNDFTFYTAPSSGLEIIVTPTLSASFTDLSNIHISVTHTEGGNNFTRSAVYTLSPVTPGADGKPATLYSLNPSLNQVKFSIGTNNTRTPSSRSVSIGVLKTVGDTTTEVTKLPTGYSLGYAFDEAITSSNTGEQLDLNGSITVASNKSFVSVGLFKGTTVIDRETIPVIADGLTGGAGKDAPHITGKDGVTFTTNASGQVTDSKSVALQVVQEGQACVINSHTLGASVNAIATASLSSDKKTLTLTISIPLDNHEEYTDLNGKKQYIAPTEGSVSVSITYTDASGKSSTETITIPVHVDVQATFYKFNVDQTAFHSEYQGFKTNTNDELTEQRSLIEQTPEKITMAVTSPTILTGQRYNLLSNALFWRPSFGVGSLTYNGYIIYSEHFGHNVLYARSNHTTQTGGNSNTYDGYRWGTNTNTGFLKLQPNSNYTLSVWVKCKNVTDSNRSVNIQLWSHTNPSDGSSDVRESVKSVTLAFTNEITETSYKVGQWHKVVVDFTTTALTDYEMFMFAYSSGQSYVCEAYFAEPMLVLGETPIDFTLSADDKDYVGGNVLLGADTFKRTLVPLNESQNKGLVYVHNSREYVDDMTTLHVTNASGSTELATWYIQRPDNQGNEDMKHATDYVLSFYAKGTSIRFFIDNATSGVQGTFKYDTLYADTCKDPTTTPVSNKYIELTIPLDSTTEWKLYRLHFVTPQSWDGTKAYKDYDNNTTINLSSVIKLGFTVPSGATAYLACPKIEEGALVTEGAGVPEGYDTEISITDKKIALTANNFTLYNNKGEKTLSADANRNVTIHNGTLSFINSGGYGCIINGSGNGLTSYYYPNGSLMRSDDWVMDDDNNCCGIQTTYYATDGSVRWVLNQSGLQTTFAGWTVNDYAYLTGMTYDEVKQRLTELIQYGDGHTGKINNVTTFSTYRTSETTSENAAYNHYVAMGSYPAITTPSASLAWFTGYIFFSGEPSVTTVSTNKKRYSYGARYYTNGKPDDNVSLFIIEVIA